MDLGQSDRLSAGVRGRGVRHVAGRPHEHVCGHAIGLHHHTGSVFICMMKFNLGQFLMAFKVAGKAFMYKGTKLDDLITKAVELADAARKGFLALEAAEIPNTFMKKGIDMLVDGHDADVVRAVMEKDIELTSERHATAIKVFRSLGISARPWA